MDRDLAIVTLQLPEARSDGVEGLWKNSTIATRSSRDRGAIEPRSRGLGRGIGADSFPIDRPVIDEALTPRSTLDRDPIVARSWQKIAAKTWQIGSEIEAKHKPIRRGIEATTQAQGIASTTTANRLHDRLHHPRFQAQFPL